MAAELGCNGQNPRVDRVYSAWEIKKKQNLCAKNPCGCGSGHYINTGGTSAVSDSAALEIRLMKVTNWTKKLSAAIVAAGIWVPSAYAVNIPLGDPSFETYVVPARGYAYAADPAGAYRVSPAPLSAWVDDLDNPPGYTQDNSASAWLYNSTYADDVTPPIIKRPAPRTGVQAMHGLANYSAQETSAVFEADTLYTFSIWAQNDELLDNSNGLFMYIFDGTIAFSDANSLANLGGAFTAINQRQPGMTNAQSALNWTQVSVSHYVGVGAPEIGNPIGVGFFARRDTAVDDATLEKFPGVPEPTSMILVGIGAAGLSLLGRRPRRD
jgi:hypothetical protein